MGIVADKKPWLDQAPCNPFVGLAIKGGLDEALNANAFSIAHEAVERLTAPVISPTLLQNFVRWGLLPLIWLSMGAIILLETGDTSAAGLVAFGLVFAHIAVVRFRNQTSHQVRHRNQPLMVKMARRFKKEKVVGIFHVHRLETICYYLVFYLKSVG